MQSVIEWQRTFNPITSPIDDRKDSKSERAANAEGVMVFPIFRDPGKPDGTPVSDSIVLEYFRALLHRVEEKYNLANSTSISFFRPNGEPVYDIHSLRVTGVTRLLHMGVDPRIVRMLVGHSSLLMTWYYEDITNQRISSAMERALEARRPTKENILSMSAGERERYLSHVFTRGSEEKLVFSLLRGMIEERSPFLDLRVDGICPGMRCADAGVWRPRACSLCRFNVTGAPFLAGIELRLNDLMAEIVLNQQEVSDLRLNLYEVRSRGGSTRSLEAEIAKKEEFVDNVIQQWEAQFQYLKRAEGDLTEWLKSEEGADRDDTESMGTSLVSPTTERIEASLEEAHHLALFRYAA